MIFNVDEETEIRSALDRIHAKLPESFASIKEVLEFKRDEKISQLKHAQDIGMVRHLQGLIVVLDDVLNLMK